MLILKKYSLLRDQNSFLFKTLTFVIEVAKYPIILLAFSYAIFSILTAFMNYFPYLFGSYLNPSKSILLYTLKMIEFGTFFWAILNALNIGQLRIQGWLISTHKTVLSILLPMISTSLKSIAILLMIKMIIPELGFTGIANEMLEKTARVALIAIITWLVIEVINGVEKLIINQYSADLNGPNARKINTQISMLKKVLVTLLMIVSVAAMLMVFDSVKALGAGILTTAGIVSAVGAFASQQSLGRIFAGLQIAFTQPISVGDTVIVDGEQGQIEEITLSYIIIKLWDLRRLVLPTDYFTNRGLQNLTRSSSELLGTVFIYTDYTLPVDEVRHKFNELIAQSSYWDGKVSNFQVTDIKEGCMELRALVSAKDSGTLWNLRCDIREKLMEFITASYPECLSKSRSLTTHSESQ